MSQAIIRELSGIAEMRLAEDLQRAVWGQADIPENSDMQLAIQHEGGLVAGAFVDGKMLGYLFAFPSAQPGVQHSHRLAVLPQARGMKLGARLKWFQRDWGLAHGIQLVRWTYDPLRGINAGLNIAGLGAVSNTYHPNYYGDMPGINAGLPSDRIMADWHLDRPEVAARAAGSPPALPEGQRIAIPRDLDRFMAENPEAALAARLSLREALQSAFAKGQSIVGFDSQSAEYIIA